MTRQNKTYEKIWDTKLLKEGNVPFQKKQPDIEVVKFLKTCNNQGKVLDIGCGAGRHCKIFADKGHLVTGFDFSKNAIKLAKSWVENADFKVGSVFDYNDGEQYDYIIDYGCLHHIQKSNWSKYKKTILKHSKSGTKLFLFAFADDSMYIKDHKLTKYEKKMKYSIYEADYCHFFSKKEIRELFKEFKIYFHNIKKTLGKNTSFHTFYLERVWLGKVFF
ncbi:MAG: class I SAM-dependent methyltransferase [Candidatus Woesearchaeota archaeon]